MSIENMFGDLDKIDILAETKTGEVVMVLVCNGFIDGSPETQKALLDKTEGYLNHIQSEEPNFFGLSISYDPYMREVVKTEQFTTCGGDGGRSICGGLGIFLGFLPCSPHCKPEVQEDKELNGDYDFYRPIIRIEVDG